MISLKDYKFITNIFNKYLLSKNPNIFTLSNPILSIVNEHSNNTRYLKKKVEENFFLIFIKFYLFKFPILIIFFFIKKIFSKKKDLIKKSKL